MKLTTKRFIIWLKPWCFSFHCGNKTWNHETPKMEIVVVFKILTFLSVHSSQQLVDLAQRMDEGIHPKSNESNTVKPPRHWSPMNHLGLNVLFLTILAIPPTFLKATPIWWWLLCQDMGNFGKWLFLVKLGISMKDTPLPRSCVLCHVISSQEDTPDSVNDFLWFFSIVSSARFGIHVTIPDC